MVDSRASVSLVDVFLVVAVLVTLAVLAPTYYKFIGMVTDAADPFSALLLQLFPPALVLGLILSVGVSARRGG